MSRSNSLYPKICICSSGQSDEYIEAIRMHWKKEHLEPLIYSINYFDVSLEDLKKLVREVEDSDFVVFIFTPADLEKIEANNGNNHLKIKEKLPFIFGLMMGIVGEERFFYIFPQKMSLPILDIIEGGTEAKYNSETENLNLTTRTISNKYVIVLVLWAIEIKMRL